MLGRRFFIGAACAALGAAAGGCASEPFEQVGGAGGTTTSSAGGGGAGGAANQGGGGSAGAGGVACQGLGDPCTDCAYTSCTSAYCACYAVEDCAALVACFNLCPPTDTTCQQTCASAHGDSISQAYLLGDCTAGACGPVTCPGVEVLDPCRRCLFENCSSTMNACLANADCLAILMCVQANCAPSDQACALGCAGQFPNGQQQALPLAGCMNNSCGGSC